MLDERLPTVLDSEYRWVPVKRGESWLDKSSTHSRYSGKPRYGWSREEIIVMQWVGSIHEYL